MLYPPNYIWKIIEITQKQAVAIKDDPDALRFLRIISDFKALYFGSIFQVCPSVSNTKYTNVKNLFRTTVVICRRKMGLPQKCWFDNPFLTEPLKEQTLMLVDQQGYDELAAKGLDNNYDQPA